MEMLQLRYFYESAMTESFSKTAKKYIVPVSSVAASVKRLEKELGVELFTRTANRIRLTEKGKQFLSVVSETLLKLDDSVATIGMNSEVKGTLSILVHCTRQAVVWNILKFHRLYPSVFFKLTFEDEPENYDKYDVIISSPEDGLEEFSSFPWRRLPIHVEALESDPLCKKKVTLNQLRDRLFVTTNAQRGTFHVFAQACKRKGFTPKVFMECDDYTCRDMVVRSGACLGLTISNSTESVLSKVEYLRISDFDVYAVSNVYYKQEKYDGNVKLFLELLKNSKDRP